MCVAFGASNATHALLRRCCEDVCDVVQAPDDTAIRQALDLIRTGFSANRPAVICAVDRTSSGKAEGVSVRALISTYPEAYWLFLASDRGEADAWKECIDSGADDVVTCPGNLSTETIRRCMLEAVKRTGVRERFCQDLRDVTRATPACKQRTPRSDEDIEEVVKKRIAMAMEAVADEHQKSMSRKDLHSGECRKAIDDDAQLEDAFVDECKTADERIRTMSKETKRLTSELKEAHAKLEAMETNTSGDKEALNKATSLQKLAKRRSRLKFDAAVDFYEGNASICSS